MVVGYRATALECSFEGCNRLGDYSQAYASKVGRFSYYGSHTRINHASIGRFCSIGSYVSLGLWSHPVGRNVSTHPVFYSSIGQAGGVSWLEQGQEEEWRSVTIGHDVWIGDYAIIRGGNSVGNGAVIGAGAVVTKDIPPYTIVAGVPAKTIRKRFSEEEVAWLEAASWWNLPEDQLRGMVSDFQDLSRFRRRA
jgi:acetyltransferase-like isoleucine patch superfamily enzyme